MDFRRLTKEGKTMITVTCDWCGYVSEPGEAYYEWDNKVFCSMECVTEYVMSDVDPLEKYVGEDDRY